LWERSLYPAGASSQPKLSESADAYANRQYGGRESDKGGEIFQVGTDKVIGQTPQPIISAGSDDRTISLNFENGDIREIVKNIIGDHLQENFIADPRVTGTVTVRTPKGIKRSDLIPTLETLLRTVGASLVKDGNIWRVVPSTDAVPGLLNPRFGPPRGDGYSVQILTVRHIGAKELQRIMIPFAKAGEASIRVDELRNVLYLSGTEFELRKLLEIAAMFDIDVFSGMSFLLYPLKYSDAKTVVADWEKLFPTGSNPLAGLLRISAIERMNALMIVSPQSNAVIQARELLERIDRPAAGGTQPDLFVYFLKNTQAQKLQTVLQQALGGARPTTAAASVAPGQTASTLTSPTSPLPGRPNVLPGNSSFAQPLIASGASDVQGNQQRAQGNAQLSGAGISIARNAIVTADADRNALLIVATPAEYAAVESVIKRLDVPPKQVAIEVQIAQVQLTGDFQFGLKSYFEGYLDSPKNRLTSANGIGSLVGSTFTYTWKKSDTIQAILNLSQSKNHIRILSQPTLITLENQKTTFEAGKQISVRTQTQNSTTTTGSVDSFQYISTGITIAVTPRVSGENIFLEIQQDISDSSKNNDGANPNPDISKNSSSTAVVVTSGDTMMLGGLFQDRGTNGSSGLPLLSAIPVLGGLFGSQGWSSDRTELVLLITPRILPNGDEGREMVDELRQKLQGIELYLPAAGRAKLPTSAASKQQLRLDTDNKRDAENNKQPFITESEERANRPLR
jgi:general secretion pathway protein D